MNLAELFLENERLTTFSCKRWLKEYPHLREDIMGEARIGLWIACKRFNPELGYEFSTYAVRVIRTNVQKHVFRKMNTKMRRFTTVSYNNFVQTGEGNTLGEDSGDTFEDILPELADHRTESLLDTIDVRSELRETMRKDVTWTLNKFYGYTAREISEMTGLPVNRVYTLVKNTQNRLRKELSDVV